MRFGRLMVTEVYSPKRRDQFRIKCVCDCGTQVDTTYGRLNSGGKLSCGCLRRDRVGGLYRTHGKSQTTEYCMFYDARKRAVAQGVPFTIAPEDIYIPVICPVLGFELSLTGSRDYRPSLDRIIPSLGYTPTNICVISFRANRIKSDATKVELRSVLSYLEDRT